MSVLVLRVSLTLFNLQGARHFSAGEPYLSTALSVCQELFSSFSKVFSELSHFSNSFFPFCAPSRDSFDRIPPISGNVKLFFQVFSIFLKFFLFSRNSSQKQEYSHSQKGPKNRKRQLLLGHSYHLSVRSPLIYFRNIPKHQVAHKKSALHP